MNEAELNEESLPHKMLQVQSYLARNFFYDLTLLNSVSFSSGEIKNSRA